MKLIIVFSIALVACFPLQELRLIKLGPNEFKTVTEDQKWELKRANINFIDITGHDSLAKSVDSNHAMHQANQEVHWDISDVSSEAPRPAVYKYPKKAHYQAQVRKIFDKISIGFLVEKLTKFSSFYTRYYKSADGLASVNWLHDQITEIVAPVKKYVKVEKYHHEWDQYSIVVRIIGKTTSKVIVGSHIDSTNFNHPETSPAPGADDDGSGTITVLEALRVLVGGVSERTFQPHNTVEFHFYAAEEGGLLGSIDVFSEYAAAKEVVLGMMQLDETGSSEKSIAHGIEPHLGLMKDFVSENLNGFIKLIIDTYNNIPYHETSCGYACSDHASALEHGYPSSFLTESEAQLTSGWIHTELDTVDRIDFVHLSEHVKLAVGYLYELGNSVIA